MIVRLEAETSTTGREPTNAIGACTVIDVPTIMHTVGPNAWATGEHRGSLAVSIVSGIANVSGLAGGAARQMWNSPDP